MKRFVLFAFMAVLALNVNAQVSAEQSKTQSAKARFQQAVELNGELLAGSVGVEYSAGCRLNPYLFLGAGFGVHYGFGNDGETMLFDVEEKFMRMNRVNVPVYANLKVWFLEKRRCMPFLSLSAGARFSTKRTAQLVMGEAEYGTGGVLANAALGADFGLSENRSIYVSVGAGMQSYPFARNIRSYQFDNSQKYKLNVDIRVGFSF